jgi:hypothetical protein
VLRSSSRNGFCCATRSVTLSANSKSNEHDFFADRIAIFSSFLIERASGAQLAVL